MKIPMLLRELRSFVGEGLIGRAERMYGFNISKRRRELSLLPCTRDVCVRDGMATMGGV